MNIQNYISELSTLSARLRLSTKTAMFAEAQAIKSELQARSPYDQGYFASQWFIARQSGNSDNSYSVAIKNNTPYGPYLDQGAEKGGPPWFFPKDDSGDNTVSKSGKLILINGRVWAGGKSPAGFVHEKGLIDSVIYDNDARKLLLAQRILNSAMRVI